MPARACLISDTVYRLVEDKVDTLNFVRTRLRGTSERVHPL